MNFKTEIVVDNCLLIKFNEQKDLTMSFFRVQEYYESANPNLYQKAFTLETFVEEQMKSDGELNYFNYWTGFNVPGYVIEEWSNKINAEYYPRESMLISLIKDRLNLDRKYYVIGTLMNDTNTIDHEIAHALYYMNLDYKNEMSELIKEFQTNHIDDYNRMCSVLTNTRQYGNNVLFDEIQAYMATEPKKELIKDFGMDYSNCKDMVKKFKKVLLKYNTYEHIG